MKLLLMHAGMIVVLAFGLVSSLPALAAPEQKYVVEPVAQKKIKELPAGPLYWRVETFPTLTDAKAAVGPDGWNPASVRYETTTSLIAEVAGKVWVVTLGPKGASTPGGTKVGDMVLFLRSLHRSICCVSTTAPDRPGPKTPVHSHPGSESFYVISGRLGQKTPDGVSYVDAGHAMAGHAPGTTMEVFNAGKTDLNALIMFVVDASKPFSVPAKFE